MPSIKKISEKKLEILKELTALGWSERKIATALEVSRSTVRHHQLKLKSKNQTPVGNPFSRTPSDWGKY